MNMTLSQLKSMVRTVVPEQKLLVIEERMFKASNTCMDDFETTGNLKALEKSVRTSYCAMAAMKNASRYHIATPISKKP